MLNLRDCVATFRANPHAAGGFDETCPVGRCPFCGDEIAHFNDGGVGWGAGAVIDGVPEPVLYCNQPPCAAVLAAPPYAVWRCGCLSDYAENLGPVCAECGRPRAAAVEYGSTADCPQCGQPLLAHDRDPDRVTLHCPGCRRGYYWDTDLRGPRPREELGTPA